MGTAGFVIFENQTINSVSKEFDVDTSTQKGSVSTIQGIQITGKLGSATLKLQSVQLRSFGGVPNVPSDPNDWVWFDVSLDKPLQVNSYFSMPEQPEVLKYRLKIEGADSETNISAYLIFETT